MNSDNELSLEDEQGINDEDDSMLDDTDEEKGVDDEGDEGNEVDDDETMLDDSDEENREGDEVDSEDDDDDDDEEENMDGEEEDQDRVDWCYSREYFESFYSKDYICEIFEDAAFLHKKKRHFDQNRKMFVITNEIEKLCSMVGKLLFGANNRKQYWKRFARLYEPGAHRRDPSGYMDYKAKVIEDWKQKDQNWSTYFNDNGKWQKTANKKEFLDRMFGLNQKYFEYPFFGIQLSLAHRSSFGYLFAPEPGRKEYKDRTKETNRRRYERIKERKQEEGVCKICGSENRPCDESSM